MFEKAMLSVKNAVATVVLFFGHINDFFSRVLKTL